MMIVSDELERREKKGRSLILDVILAFKWRNLENHETPQLEPCRSVLA